MLETKRGIILKLNVKTNSKKFQIKIVNDEFIVFCPESPVKGKVNSKVIKEFSKRFNKKVSIVSGFTSKKKRILIHKMNEKELNSILQKNSFYK